MKRLNALGSVIVSIIILISLAGPLYARGIGGGLLNMNTMRRVATREYKEYVKKITSIRAAMKQKAWKPENDPLGMIFVSDILKYKGSRRHQLKTTNDAEQLLIRAIESVEKKDYAAAFALAQEAVERDKDYVRARFLLAGLYERRGDIKNMEKAYRYYLRKTLFLRKMAEVRTKAPDVELKFIKEKFDRYRIGLSDPSLKDINNKYMMIGVGCIALLGFIFIIFLMERGRYG